MKISKRLTIAERCRQIGSQVRSERNFVRVWDLAEKLNAYIVARPLLVEASLASNDDPGAFDARDWVVLLDSGRFGISEFDLRNESRESPLPPRLRNTIAHELTHILAFKGERAASGFFHEQRSGETQDQYLRRIEKDIEAFSPLLLISEQVVERICTTKHSLSEINELRKQCVVSREVFISRLNLAFIQDRSKTHYATGLSKTLIGLAEWGSQSAVRALPWPYFFGFNDLLPDFIRASLNGEETDLSKLIDDSDFILCGGDKPETFVSLKVGTEQKPTAEEKVFLFEAEDVPRERGKKFLFSATVVG